LNRFLIAIASKPREFSLTFDLPKAKIATLRLAYRPYETVEISNIAKTETDRTDVQMKIAPTTEPSQ
jgi:hypothetical protein